MTDYLVDTSFNAFNKRAKSRSAHIAGLCLPVLFCLCTRMSLHTERFFMRLYVWFRSKDGSIPSLNVECVKLLTFLRVLTRTLFPSFSMICRCRSAQCHLAVLFHVAVKPFLSFSKQKNVLKLVFFNNMLHFFLSIFFKHGKSTCAVNQSAHKRLTMFDRVMEIEVHVTVFLFSELDFSSFERIYSANTISVIGFNFLEETQLEHKDLAGISS